METTVQEPQGIPFFSIKTGETHYCKLEPTISAYINSSDMGINASRGQDYGWRLAPEWVKKVRAFKRDSTQMSILTAKNQGQKPTTVQILYYLYGEELARHYESQEENENPFEDQYRDDIDGRTTDSTPVNGNVPQALADFQTDDEDMADLIDDVITDDEDKTAPAPEQPKQPETTGVDPAKPGEDKSVETTVKNENGKLTVPKTDGKTSTNKTAKQSQK